MTGPAIVLAAAAWLAVAQASSAPGLRFLLRDGRVCDADRVMCLAASITYEPNDRLLSLHGRVAATGPAGVFVVVFAGHARDGTRRYAEMRIPLDGHYSEIARHRMIPDWPEVTDWALDHARFEPRGEDRAER